MDTKTNIDFKLIMLIFLIIITTLLVFIMIVPRKPRRSKAAGSSLGNLKAFTTAMETYSQDQDDQSYPANDEVFGDYYSHIDTKGGYKYIYDCDGKHFVYYAQPTSLSNGQRAFFVNETSRLWYVTFDLSDYDGAKTLKIRWNETGKKRLATPKYIEEDDWVEIK